MTRVPKFIACLLLVLICALFSSIYRFGFQPSIEGEELVKFTLGIQYYLLEPIAFSYVLLKACKLKDFVEGTKWLVILSFAFVAFEVALAGGINFTAISNRKIGIGKGSITGMFDEPALLAYTYSILLPVIFFGVFNLFLRRVEGGVLISLLILIIALSLTRIAYLNVVLVLGILIGYVWFSRVPPDQRYSKIFLRRFVYVALFAFPIILYGLLQKILSRSGDQDVTSSLSSGLGEGLGIDLPNLPVNALFRMDQTQASIRYVMDKPLGCGPFQGDVCLKEFLIFDQFSTFNAGNLFLDLSVSFGLFVGIASLASALWLTLLVFKSKLRSHNKFTLVALLSVIWINILLATNVMVAYTDAVEKIVLNQKILYVFSDQLFVGPRNLDGIVFMFAWIFVYLSVKSSEGEQNGN